MIQDALAAFAQVFSQPFRRVLWKSLGLTLSILVLAWFGLEQLATYFVTIDNPWLATTVSVLTGVGLVVGLAFLVAPVSALVAGFYLDELAEQVETSSEPRWPAGQPLPAGQAMALSARFAALALLVNVMALMLLLVPGVNAIAFLGANAYLMGREVFRTRRDALSARGRSARAAQRKGRIPVHRGAAHRAVSQRAGAQPAHAAVRRGLHGAHPQARVARRARRHGRTAPSGGEGFSALWPNCPVERNR